MAQQVKRWIEVTPSQFTHEAEGLSIVRELLPDQPPFRAWSNFEFRDSQGKWHEVDLLVLGRRRLHLVELKGPDPARRPREVPPGRRRPPHPGG